MEGAKYTAGCTAIMQYSGRPSKVQWGGGCHALQWKVQVQLRAILQYDEGLSAVWWRAIIQYSGGISEVQWGGGYLQYGGGLSCSIVEGKSTVEGYLAVRSRAISSTVGGGGLSCSTEEGAEYGGGLSCSSVDVPFPGKWRAIPEYIGRCIALRRDLVISLTKVCVFPNNTKRCNIEILCRKPH